MAEFSGVYPGVYPSILALCLVAWVFILHRRSRFSATHLAVSIAFANERNAIIDSFGRDESLEAILNRICSLVESHLEGSTCRIDLIREGGVARDGSAVGLPIVSIDGNTVATMRVSGHQQNAESQALLEEILRLSAQAIEQRRLYDRLLRQSPQSMLEGIVDPVLLNQRLEAALARARVHGHEVAFVHVGLENFEDINEVLGAEAAEAVLHCAAFRLLACTRPSDHVARVARDEFAVILTEMHGVANAEEVARRIVSTLDAPVGVEHASIHVGAAVGVCVFPDQAHDSGEMQRRAHLAMYSAKTGAESRFSFYQDDSESDSRWSGPASEGRASSDLLILCAALPHASSSGFSQNETTEQHLKAV